MRTLAKLPGNAFQFVLVKQAEVLCQRRLGVSILRCTNIHLHLGLHISTNGDGTCLVLCPSLAANGVTQRTVVKEDEIIQRVALEELAVLSTLELEALVELEETAQQANLSASLTLEVVGTRAAHLQYSTYLCFGQIEIIIDKAQVEVKREQHIEIGIKLTLTVPSLVTWNLAEVHTIAVFVVDDRDIEA